LTYYAANAFIGDRLPPFELKSGVQLLSEDSNSRAIPGASYFWCPICHRRIKSCPESTHRNDKRTLSSLAFVRGQQMLTDMDAMQKLFDSHVNSLMHLTSILYDVEKDRIKLENGASTSYRYKATDQYKKLANIFDVTFTFVHTNTAPSNAASWYRTLNKIEAEVGVSHHSRQTAFAIINFIASIGTNNIIEQLIENNSPFSLILDGSSDSRNYHYVLVYLHCLEGEVTIPYFLFLLELQTTFSAEDYLTAIRLAVSNKGRRFEQYFKSNLVGIISDSANVMKKLHRLVNIWMDRKDDTGEFMESVSIFCIAHKLQLATRSSIVPLKSDTDIIPTSPLAYFSIVEKFMQSAYVWFKWSGRRMGIFREESEIPKVEMKELHLQRWISSEYDTTKNFIRSWVTALNALDRIIDDRSLDKKTKKEAEEYLVQFHDKTALITIHFLWDYTGIFKIWSEYLQKMSGLIIDQQQYFDQLLENLKILEEFRGTVLTTFLQQCTCDTEVCTLITYERSESIVWKGKTFSRNNKEAPAFTKAAEALLKKTKARLDFYIPVELITASDVLNQKKLPPGALALDYQHPKAGTDGEIRIYGENKIRHLTKRLGFNTITILRDWAAFLDSMQRSPNWEAYRPVTDSNMFWALWLKDDDVDWTPTLKRFIRTIKTLAPGSTACESGFSIFNVIKTKARMNLKDNHVESIMKILINGPGSVDLFDSYRYAHFWVLAGHRLSKEATDTSEDSSCPIEGNMPIESDIGYQAEDIEMFPGEALAPVYSDAYTEIAKTKEFRDNTKSKRAETRYRSKIM